MLAYVLNKHGEPLMPCSTAKARRLLKEGKAKVVSREPFTIKLLFGSSGHRQEVSLSVDAGANHIGAAAKRKDGKVLYASETKTRDDIKDRLTERRSYRRTRRGRKTRYRAPRFDNRRRSDGWLTPTVRSKVQAHIAEIAFIKSILPVSRTVIETAAFDIHKLSDPTATDYQKGRQKGFYNVKQFVLFRDGHSCQECKGKKKDNRLHVHHIVFRSNGGTDSPDNLITLCESCHSGLHAKKNAQKVSSERYRPKNGAGIRGATIMSTISAVLESLFVFEKAHGYETKWNRERLSLPKTHYFDAMCVGLGDSEKITPPDCFYQKVRIQRRDKQRTRGRHSEEKIPTGKISGIRKFDKVLWNGREYFVKGRMSTGYAILMTIDGKKVDLKPIPKLSKMKRLSARSSCLTSRMVIENTRSSFTLSLSSNTEKNSLDGRTLDAL